MSFSFVWRPQGRKGKSPDDWDGLGLPKEDEQGFGRSTIYTCRDAVVHREGHAAWWGIAWGREATVTGGEPRGGSEKGAGCHRGWRRSPSTTTTPTINLWFNHTINKTVPFPITPTLIFVSVTTTITIANNHNNNNNNNFYCTKILHQCPQ
eukprot:Gb_17019 [translate_table: standard]